MVHPLAILAIGVVAILVLILVLRANAFLALIASAMLVSVLAPGELDDKVARVASAFGDTCGEIGIVIAMAAIVGQCMADSGAADRIVRGFLKVLGEKRASWALMGSGFVLSVPVFFDTVFYLLVPLARSLYKRTNRDFLKYALAIGAGAAATHTLVPPTPGPLAVAAELGVDLGWMIMLGALVALPTSIAGLAFAAAANRMMPIPLRLAASESEPAALDDSQLPPLFWSALPVVLPVLMISLDTVMRSVVGADQTHPWRTVGQWATMLGNQNLALSVSAVIAMALLVRQRRMTLVQLGKIVETALMSAGVIIVIVAAGGAFGEMLKAAEIGEAVEQQFGGRTSEGMMLMLLGFVIAVVFKVAVGSSTVAMITTAAMIAGMLPEAGLPFNGAYVATAIGGGSLVGFWMNDSGFWIVARMSGMTEAETLKSWTPMFAVMGVVALAASVLFAVVLPLATVAPVVLPAAPT